VAKNRILIVIIIAITAIVVIAQLTKNRRLNLKIIKSTQKEKELRENWNSYMVYKRLRPDQSFQRGAVALLYQLKDGGMMILDDKWIPVASEPDMANTKIMEAVTSAEILGHHRGLFGYLVYRSADRPNVKIVDEGTVQLFYHYNRDYSN
jgi:protein-L-isoaspartate O-methyltransferase